MPVFSLDDFPDPPEGSGFADDIPFPVGVVTSGTVVFSKAKPEKSTISVKVVQDIDGSTQFAVWHNINLGGEWGHIGKGQLTKMFGDRNLVPRDWDDVAAALKGVELQFKPVANGDFINLREIKVTKTVQQLKASEGLGGLASLAAPAPAPAPVAPAPAPVAPAPAPVAPAPVPAAPATLEYADPF